MRPFACLLVLLTAAAMAAADEPEHLRRLVSRLASPDFRERQAAARELDRLGEPALDALRQAERSGDTETRLRAAELIERIGRRQAIARILTPTLVTLDYENTPLSEAVADLNRRTGLSISLHADNEKVAGRAVTLFAEKVTPWQAIRLLCHRAGLHVWDGVAPLPPVVPADGPGAPGGLIVLGQMPIRRGQGGALTVPSPVARMDLLDGPGHDLPSCDVGSVRVCAGPAGSQFSAPAGTTTVGLQIVAEGRLHIDGAAELRIERAVDEHGRLLAGQPVWLTPPDEPDNWPRGVRLPPQVTERKHGPVAVRFERAELPARRLRELAGVVTIQTFAAEPVIDMTEPAIGKSVRNGGVALSLASWSRVAEGEVRAVAEVQLPYGTRLKQPVAGVTRGGRRWAGFIMEEPEPVPVGGDEYQGLSVADAAGRRFIATTGCAEIAGLFPEHYIVHIAATFRSAGGAKPDRVGFAVRRAMSVDVPFVLRDVPLP